ncbi:MAG: glycosyltransferase family 2 protein, partial [Candidatus Aenigmarchaeota archaeon]|nr:glycosyltransferase family 2 protein [Candidatus Aenigmarchaeota archaeon]
DGIVGSKRHPLSRVEYPFKRKVLSSMYNWMTRAMFGLKIMDTQVGLKL